MNPPPKKNALENQTGKYEESGPRSAQGEFQRRAWPARAGASREVGHTKAGMCVSFGLGSW